MNEPIYRLLLRLYPNSFRQHFGDALLQHFRDQRRDAQNAPGKFRMIRFSFKIITDTMLTAAREHLSRKPKLTTSNQNADMKKVPSFRFLFFAFLIPLIIGVALMTYMQPRTFVSTARWLIRHEVGRVVTDPNGHQIQSGGPYDPYFIQTQVALITSDSVLQQVALELGLAKTMAERFGIKTKFESLEAATLLRRQIEVRQDRNTSLLELRVYSESPAEAAAVAERIWEVYHRQNPAVEARLIDAPNRPLRPIRPNVPLNIVLGLLVSSALSAIASFLLRLLLSKTMRPTAAPTNA